MYADIVKAADQTQFVRVHTDATVDVTHINACSIRLRSAELCFVEALSRYASEPSVQKTTAAV